MPARWIYIRGVINDNYNSQTPRYTADAFSLSGLALKGGLPYCYRLTPFADAPITHGWSLTGTVQDAVFMS